MPRGWKKGGIKPSSNCVDLHFFTCCCLNRGVIRRRIEKKSSRGQWSGCQEMPLGYGPSKWSIIIFWLCKCGIYHFCHILLLSIYIFATYLKGAMQICAHRILSRIFAVYVASCALEYPRILSYTPRVPIRIRANSVANMCLFAQCKFVHIYFFAPVKVPYKFRLHVHMYAWCVERQKENSFKYITCPAFWKLGKTSQEVY